MKKQILVTATLLAVFIGVRAQKPDTAWLIVHYKYSWIMDTANHANPYSENMALFIGKRASVYISYDGFVSDQQFKKAYAEAQTGSLGETAPLNRSGKGLNPQYFQYPGEGKLFTRLYLLTTAYLVEDPMPVIDWKIISDTATFGGLHCQKAIGHFKGRDYVAWFCPDLPVHTGPWKLNGLPGAIVDAYDTKKEVVFAFDGVEKTSLSLSNGQTSRDTTNEQDLPTILRGLNYDPNFIEPPAQAIKTTQKEIDRLRAAIRKDPNAYAHAMNAANSHAGSDHMIPALRQAPGIVINNPVELPDK